MTARQCTRCGSANVDFEGYCWSCEYQQPDVRPGPWDIPPGHPDPQSTVPEVPLAVAARPRSRAGRIVAMILAPVATVAVIGCAAGGYALFRAANSAMEAAPGTILNAGSGAGARGTIGGCLVGRWQATSYEYDVEVDGVGKIHMTGVGEVLTFAEDGSGSLDLSGATERGLAEGKTLTTSGGTARATFRYAVLGPTLTIDQISETGQTPLRVGGTQVVVTSGFLAGGEATLACAGTTLTISNSRFNGTYARVDPS